MQNQNTNLSERIAKELQEEGVCFVETKLDKLGMRPTLMIIDDPYLLLTEEQKVAMKKWCSSKELELLYKGKYNMRDNNCEANHKRGLEKRIANYATQHTLATIQNSPAKLALHKKQTFYYNVAKMLKLV